jgi:hypothetical protein
MCDRDGFSAHAPRAHQITDFGLRLPVLDRAFDVLAPENSLAAAGQELDGKRLVKFLSRTLTPTLWCVRPERRFVSDKRTNPLLALAAALLSIASVSPSSVVTILPARCYVGHERILLEALKQVASELPHIPEGTATLGMLDIDEGVDEDYMVVGRSLAGHGLTAHGIAQRPTAWVARHLRLQGAVNLQFLLRRKSTMFSFRH